MTEHEELTITLLNQLDKLLWKVSWNIADEGRWQLEHEEVHAELVRVLVEIVARYADKPYDQLLMIAKRSIYNKITDLALACYKSHRNAEQYMVDLDDDSLSEVLGTEMSDFDLSGFMSSLSDDAKKLAGAVLHPDQYDVLMFHLNLAVTRKKATSPSNGWNLTMTPTILQRGLGWDRLRLSRAWGEITQALRKS